MELSLDKIDVDYWYDLYKKLETYSYISYAVASIPKECLQD